MAIKTTLRLSPILLLLIISACTSSREVAITDPDMKLFTTWLSGDFSNQAQHQNDTTFEDQRLHIRRIWPQDKKHIWLYSELALAGLPNKPFEQHIYQLDHQYAKGIQMKLFTLSDPDTYIGAYQHPEVFKKLKSTDLLPQEGCTLLLNKRQDGSYSGGLQGKGCAEARQGAAYAITLLVVKEKRMRYWERGYDGEGKQVWGPVTAGVDFVK